MKSDPWDSALSMLTCIYISEQVLCQQIRTWALFLLQPSLLALYFRRLELVAVSTREPSSSSFPNLNPHLNLQPVIPKRFLWRPLWDLPFEPQYTWSRSSTPPTLLFPEHKVLWTHELLTHIYWRLKKKKTTRKKPQNQSQNPPASWTKHIDFSKPRQGGQGWAGHTLSMPMLARKASCDSVCPIPQAIKSPVSFKGRTCGFPVLYVLLLTEQTTQIVGSFC